MHLLDVKELNGTSYQNGSMMILNKLLNFVIIVIKFKIFLNIEHRDIYVSLCKFIFENPEGQ